MDREILRKSGAFDYENLIETKVAVKSAIAALLEADKKMTAGDLLGESDLDTVSRAIRILAKAESTVKARIREKRQEVFGTAANPAPADLPPFPVS